MSSRLKILKGVSKWIDVIVFLVLLMIVLPPIIPRFLLSDILAWSILVYGFNLLYGFLGYLSFGHLAYFATGAYMFACSIQYLHIDPLLAIVLAALAGALAGAVFGIATVKKGGAYFALTNLSISVIVYYIVLYFLKDYTGGFEGRFINLKSNVIDLTLREIAYYVIVTVFIMVFVFYKILSRSTFVLLLQAIKENEDRVKFLGYNTFLLKYLAYIISATISALGGAMLVLSHAYVSATTYMPGYNGEIVVMSMIGGASTLYGAFIGAMIYLGLKYVIAAYIIRWELVVGIILLITMMLTRGLGIWGLLEKTLKQRLTILLR